MQNQDLDAVENAARRQPRPPSPNRSFSPSLSTFSDHEQASGLSGVNSEERGDRRERLGRSLPTSKRPYQKRENVASSSSSSFPSRRRVNLVFFGCIAVVSLWATFSLFSFNQKTFSLRPLGEKETERQEAGEVEAAKTEAFAERGELSRLRSELQQLASALRVVLDDGHSGLKTDELKNLLRRREETNQSLSSSSSSLHGAKANEEEGGLGEKGKVREGEDAQKEELSHWKRIYASHHLDVEEECREVFDLESLSEWRKGRHEYCLSGSSSLSMRCYTFEKGHNSGRDVFCNFLGKVKHEGGGRFSTAFCDLRDKNEDEREDSPPAGAREGERKERERERIPAISLFPEFMYETGLGYYFHSGMVMNFNAGRGAGKKLDPECQTIDSRRTYVIKREGERNLFHCMSELFSLFMTDEVLAEEGAPSPDQQQIIFIDNREEGRYWDAWRAVASELRRADDVPAGTCFDNVVLPIAGGSNPFWKGDWVPLGCEDSLLLQHMAHRVIKHFDLSPSYNTAESIQITFIDRKQKRKLIGHKEAFEKVAQKYSPSRVKIQEVDFASITFPEQIKAIRGTDILIGVHGAGLGHILWLPEEAVVLEVMPSTVKKSTYRNIAKLMKKSFLSLEGEVLGTDWDTGNIKVATEDFYFALESAIRMALNFGKRAWSTSDIVKI